MSSKKDSIRVFLRVRPDRHKRSFEQRFSVDHTFDHSVIQFHVDRKAEADIVNHSVEDYRFKFDRVFEPKSTQEDIFNLVAKDSVLSALDGFNSTIFAYGQTGSGKTFTITGGTESYNDRGIIPRTLSLIYEEIAKRTDFEWTVRISYLQIYNDKGQDLLNRGNDSRSIDDLPVVTVHETDDEVLLKGLEAHTSSTVHEALNLLFLGDTNRLYCETPMNKSSSRSHCIFTISLEARGHGSATVRRSKLNLVDLAGSERVGKTGVSGNLLTEAKYINLSLHFLEHVIVSLADRRDHVPFRNSMMTMVLRDSLGGNCRTAMIATAYPTDDLFLESISTCKFAQRVAQIRQNAKVNEETDPTVVIRKLKAEVAQLKEQLAVYTKGDQSDADRALSSDELQRCQEIVSRFLEDPDPKSQITGLGGDFARIIACFAIMKTIIKAAPGGKLSAAQAAAQLGGSAAAGRLGTSSGGGASSGGLSSEQERRLQAQIEALTVSLQQKENELSLLFNIVEKQNVAKFNAQTQTGETGSSTDVWVPTGRGAPPAADRSTAAPQRDSVLGLLSRSASGMSLQPSLQQSKAAHALPSSLNAAQAQVATEFLERQEQLRENYDLSALTDADMLKDRAAAFEAFRRSYRKFEQVERNKEDLKQRYERCKALAEAVNSYVDAIKKLKIRIQQLRNDRALQGGGEPDADEGALMSQLDETKKQYASTAKELGQEKGQVDHIHLIMMRAQEQLAKDFEEWFGLRQKQVILAQQQQQQSGPTSAVPTLPPVPGASRTPPGDAFGGRQSSMLSSSIVAQIQSTQAQRPTVSSAPGNSAPAVPSGITGRLASSGALHVATAVPPPPTVPQVGNFLIDQHQRNLTEHAQHNRMMEGLEARNPYAPSYATTGNAEADAELAQMYKAREEMRNRLLGR